MSPGKLRRSEVLHPRVEFCGDKPANGILREKHTVAGDKDRRHSIYRDQFKRFETDATFDGRSVSALSNEADRSVMLLKLSSSTAGPPSSSAAEMRFSNSSLLPSGGHRRGLAAISHRAQMHRASLPASQRPKPAMLRGTDERAGREPETGAADRAKQRNEERALIHACLLAQIDNCEAVDRDGLRVGEAEGLEGVANDDELPRSR